MLIEDEPTLAASIELMLRSENIEPTTTEFGWEGLKLAVNREHDIILLDLNLPDMSG